MKYSKRLKILFCWLSIVALKANWGVAQCQCGQYRSPSFHFDSVSDDGTLYFAEEWFKIGGNFPFVVSFDNTRGTSSPYLGSFWRINLFESHVYSVDEKKVAVIRPDGYKYTFIKKEDARYRGNQGWVGKKVGNIFTAVDSCGGGELVFENGYLKKFSYLQEDYELKRDSNGLVTEIVRDRQKVLTCRFGDGNRLRSISAGGRDFFIEHEPVIPVGWSASEMLKHRVESPLRRVTLADGTLFRGYQLDLREDCSLQVTDGHVTARNFVWDRSTLHLKSALGVFGEIWNFSVTNEGDWVKIERHSKLGDETLLRNPKEGMSVIQTGSSAYERTTRFTKGPLRNHIKKVEESSNGVDGWVVTLQRSYDTNGSVIREINYKDNEIRLVEGPSKDGVITETVQGLKTGLPVRRVTKISSRILETVLYGERVKITYNYDNAKKLISRNFSPIND